MDATWHEDNVIVQKSFSSLREGDAGDRNHNEAGMHVLYVLMFL